MDNPDLISVMGDGPFVEVVRHFLEYILEHEGINTSGTQFSSSQIEDFLQTSPPVDKSTLEEEDQKCSICMSEYRGNNEPVTKSEQGLLGEEASESPVKLPCGHVFGDLCIKEWLLTQHASCPLCRFQFRPVRSIDS